MKKILVILGIAGLIVAFLTLGQAIALALAIANICEGAPFEDQTIYLVGFFLCFSFRHILIFFRDRGLDRYAKKQAEDLRGKLLQRAFSPQSLVASQTGSAGLITLLTDGIDNIENYIRLMPPKICGLLTVAFPLLIGEYIFDWVSGVILTITFPVIIYFMILLGRQARSQAEKQYGRYRVLSNHFMDTLRGLSTLRSFGINTQEEKQVYNVSEKLRKSTIKTISIATLSSALMDLTATLGVAAVAMMLAFRLMDGSISLTIGLTSLMLAPEFYTPIRTFAADFHASLDAKNSLEDVLEILDDNAMVNTPKLALQPWNEKSILKFNHVSFHYKNKLESEALESKKATGISDISFEIQGFQKIGIIGPSGCGKTTLANLLAGLSMASDGTIELNNINLIDLSQSEWMDQIHYIPQNPYIFHTTLRNNIAFYTPNASEEAIYQAIEATGLCDLVSELPHGLDTVIGDAGRTLSGGQAGRVALARAFLDKRPILIFDEPTAHLDIETELDLKKIMVPLMENRLVFFATHRLHWLNEMDRIFLLDKGSLKEIIEENVESNTPVYFQPRKECK